MKKAVRIQTHPAMRKLLTQSIRGVLVAPCDAKYNGSIGMSRRTEWSPNSEHWVLFAWRKTVPLNGSAEHLTPQTQRSLPKLMQFRAFVDRKMSNRTVVNRTTYQIQRRKKINNWPKLAFGNSIISVLVLRIVPSQYSIICLTVINITANRFSYCEPLPFSWKNLLN